MIFICLLKQVQKELSLEICENQLLFQENLKVQTYKSQRTL
jgi:hypothetical protein